MYTAELLTRSWKQPKSPLKEEWVKKVWYVYTMEYYSVIKRTKFFPLQ